jgi:phosphoenolpyruvate carboxylase
MFVRVGSKNWKRLKKSLSLSLKSTCISDVEADKIDLMFCFIQYIERQIVLFDAEDAAFPTE